MNTITGGEVLARCLANEGVKFLFGLPSPEIDPLLARLAKHGIRLMPVRHEAAGVHMAEGLYKTTGQVAAVLGNPGPGSANLLPGVITARHEGVPVLVITSQHRLGIVYPSPPSTFQGQDQLDVFKPVVKWGGPILSWERIPEVVRLAFREMWTGRPGPVQIELPAPVLYAKGEERGVSILPPEAYRPSRPQASEAQLRQAADLLANAARPLVVSGSGVDRAAANSALLEIVKLLGCPVMSTMAGRASVPLDHPNYVFGFGPGGDEMKKEADVILVAGSRLGNLDIPYDKYWGDPTHQKLIQIDIDPRNMGVTRPLTLGIVADVKNALEGLAQKLRAMKASPRDGKDLARYREGARGWWDEQLSAVTELERAWHPSGSRNGSDRLGLRPRSDLRYGRRKHFTMGERLFATDAATFVPQHPRAWHARHGDSLGNRRQARCAEARRGMRDRRRCRRLQFHGDAIGGARRHQDHDRRLCRRLVDHGGAERADAVRQDVGTDQGTIRWDRVAEGLGCHGEYADKIEEVEPALQRAKAAKEPAALCLRTSRDANLMIPKELMLRFAEVYQGPMG